MLSLSRLVVFVETSQTLPAILFFTAIAYKQTRIVAIIETQTRISCLQARSKMLCAVDYIFNLLCAFNCLQPMKKFVFSVASRATGRLQIKPSGSGDENENDHACEIAHLKSTLNLNSNSKNEAFSLNIRRENEGQGWYPRALFWKYL